MIWKLLGSRYGAAFPSVRVGTRQEIDAAFATFARERPDALFVGTDTFFSSPGASN